MEPPEIVEVHLNDVCRTCLSKTDNMLNFTQKNDQTSEIIAMLSSVGNIEIELHPSLPSHLCKACEEKLRVSYDFQILIQRSNDIIQQCVNGANLGLDEVKTEDEVEIVEHVYKVRHADFLSNEVEEEISEYKKRFLENKQCIKCKFISSNSRALAVHMSRLHKETKEHWCSICNLDFDNLEEHSAQHAEDHLKCKFCGKKFNVGGHFYEHLRTHSSVKPYPCHLCSRGFIAQRHLDKHLRIHTKSKSRLALRIHLKNHKHSKTEASFSTPQNFCKVCKKRVRSLPDHLHNNHNPNKTNDGILCTLCGKKFSSLPRFRMHMRTHTGEAPYKCQYCDKRMKNRNHVIVHERTHTGERPYVCNICGRSFSQTSVLNTHMKIHTGRPVVCEICAQRFCRPAELRLHMRKHTGEKPYQCGQCDRAFKQQSHLSEHLKRHSDERPFKCTYCDKSFKQKSILKSHVTVHTGEKPFKCSQCAYACRQRYSLTQHMKQHSVDAPDPEKPHLCDLCQKGYSTMAMLMSHNDLVHKGVKNFG